MKLSLKKKIFFLDSLASLVSAGIPIVRALQILYFQSEEKSLREAAKFLKTELEKGSNIALAASKMPEVFSYFDRSLIEMGEATGKIGNAFESIVRREEKHLELSGKVRQALIYPIAIIFVAIAMVSIIMVYVIPKIETVYKEANTALPALTKAVIGFSRFIREEGLFLLIGFLLLVGIVNVALRNKQVRYYADLALLKLPVFGRLIQKQILITFTEFLSSLLTSGITINKALSITSEALGNTVYQKEVANVGEDVKNGKSLSASIGGEYTERRIRGEKIDAQEAQLYTRKIECFPIELSTAIKVGEQTGSMASMLAKTGERYNRDIDTLIKWLSSMLEPIIILGIGSIVGTIVLAVMLPFFNMANVIH